MQLRGNIKNTFRELKAYQKGFELSMDIFQLTKKFPKEEQYGLVSQIRRSSRAVCANIGEGYRKRQYEKYFSSRLADADMENTETQVWLDFSLCCEYIDEEIYDRLILQSEEVGKIISYMINNTEKFMPLNKKINVE